MLPADTLRQVARAQVEEITSRDLGMERELLPRIPLGAPVALVLTGVRRCGKSTLLAQLARHRIERFSFFNFEDSRVIGLSVPEVNRLTEVLDELNGPSASLLFDEIQHVEGWEVPVRTLVDRGRRVILTGSNASLLGSTLGAKLTGRHLDIEVFPFSFPEYLLFRREKPGRAAFERYLREGGFPSHLKFPSSELLRELFTDIVDRDVLARHRVREEAALREAAVFLLSNVAKEVSYRSLARLFDLRSATTASTFVARLEDAYLVQTVPLYDASMKRRLLNPKKVYAIDTALARANSTSFSEDLGGALENAAFLHLRRQFREIFYFRSKDGRAECDLVVRERGDRPSVYQVCWSLSQDNLSREVGGLRVALEHLGLREGTILTLDQEDLLAEGGKRFRVRPLWKWVLGLE